MAQDIYVWVERENGGGPMACYWYGLDLTQDEL